MLGTIGDLVEDVIVHLLEPIREATDTASLIHRRRGGSAANVAATAAARRNRSRFAAVRARSSAIAAASSGRRLFPLPTTCTRA